MSDNFLLYSLQANSSDLTSVELEQATLISRGTYRCEVSADAPSFQTVYEERYMKVLGKTFISELI